MNNVILYVYGIVRDGFDPAGAPAGLDESAVDVRRSGSVAALVSRLEAAAYAADVVEVRSGDVGWLSPRAMAHDRVLTWAQERGGVLPLPMFSLWGSDAALSQSLVSREREFTTVFDRVRDADEFGVRIHRRDDVMLKTVDELDPAMAALRKEAEAASPGQRYLIERKFAEQSKVAIRAASQRMAKRVFEELSSLARDAVARPIVPDKTAASDATMVLNGAFLVERAKLEAFRATLGARVRELQPRGLTFDFTGPWPPYNFTAPLEPKS